MYIQNVALLVTYLQYFASPWLQLKINMKVTAGSEEEGNAMLVGVCWFVGSNVVDNTWNTAQESCTASSV